MDLQSVLDIGKMLAAIGAGGWGAQYLERRRQKKRLEATIKSIEAKTETDKMGVADMLIIRLNELVQGLENELAESKKKSRFTNKNGKELFSYVITTVLGVWNAVILSKRF
jgi:hypothetical protein